MAAIDGPIILDMQQETNHIQPWQDLEEYETEMAGQEAALIGGDSGHQALDPAWQAIEEAGGGESEGWEQAEEDLILNATHSNDHSDTEILVHAFPPEFEIESGLDFPG